MNATADEGFDVDAEDPADREERIFDRICDDLSRSPYLVEGDIDFYLEGTTARLASSDRVMPAAGRLREPTAKELEVLLCLSHGLTAVMAAKVIGISSDVVDDRVASVKRKLRAKNTTQACAEALRKGLIE